MSTSLDKHARCLELLPAFVGGTLPASAATALLAHTSECAACGAELDLARRMNAYFARQWTEVRPILDPAVEQAGFDRLWARITDGTHPAETQPSQRKWPARAAALAATLLLGAGFLWYLTAGTPQYRTLADPSRSCVALQVRFAAQTPPADALRMIEAAGASVVGSASYGAYTVRARDPAESLRRLRLVSGVSAEPTDC
jgi:hypothetical protein